MEATEPIDYGKPLSLRNLFEHPDVHPVVLDLAMLKLFGPAWLGWEMETIQQEVTREVCALSEKNKSKLQAVKTAHVSTAPWTTWQVFEKVANALSGTVARWDVMQALSLSDLYIAVTTLELLRSPAEFDDEVLCYMAATALHNDVFFLPPPLDVAQVDLEQAHLRCKDCGTEELEQLHDGLCINCAEKMSTDHGLSMRPSEEALKDGRGRNLEQVVRYDPTSTRMLWEQIQGLPADKAVLGDDAASLQVEKLLAARAAVERDQAKLKEQKIALRSWLGAP
jgi:hypothetical protein